MVKLIRTENRGIKIPKDSKQEIIKLSVKCFHYKNIYISYEKMIYDIEQIDSAPKYLSFIRDFKVLINGLYEKNKKNVLVKYHSFLNECLIFGIFYDDNSLKIIKKIIDDSKYDISIVVPDESTPIRECRKLIEEPMDQQMLRYENNHYLRNPASFVKESLKKAIINQRNDYEKIYTKNVDNINQHITKLSKKLTKLTTEYAKQDTEKSRYATNDVFFGLKVYDDILYNILKKKKKNGK